MHIMKKIKLSIILFAAIAFITACLKVERVSEIPSIEFISFEVFDTIDILQNNLKGGRLKFKFEDGDGDMGLINPEDTTKPANFKLSLYRKIDGAMQLVTDSKDPLLPGKDCRIPYLEPVGQSKVLRGEIIISLLYTSYTPTPTDTIKYDFYIVDRAGNLSNSEETAEIIVVENGIYKK